MTTPGAIDLPRVDAFPDSRRCLICGKPVNVKLALRVHCVDGTVERIAPIGQETDEAGDMGYWPVGPDCAKRLPAAYVRTADR